jgi:hypothetical protein
VEDPIVLRYHIRLNSQFILARYLHLILLDLLVGSNRRTLDVSSARSVCVLYFIDKTK